MPGGGGGEASRDAPLSRSWADSAPRAVASGSMIGIGGHLAVPPSHTTGHTGPYHGGSIGLGVGRNVEVGKTETVEIRVAQGLLDRRVSGHAPPSVNQRRPLR